MANMIPEKLINFRVYLNGVDLLGAADVQLPSIEAMKETISGAGIAGEVDSPVLGHYGPMVLSLKWRVIWGDILPLAAPGAHQLDLRGAIQRYDSGSGEISSMPMRVVVKGLTKKFDLGRMEAGKKQDSSLDFECVYLKLSLNNAVRVEIDKYNFMAVIDGEDYLSDVRMNLGLG